MYLLYKYTPLLVLIIYKYIKGVSGSTWAMSQFYSPLTNASVSTLKDHLSSRIHTHIANLSNFLTVLNASRHNSKIILHGVIQRYYQQNGTISLVDIFGMLLGGTLLSRKLTVTAAPDSDNEDDDAEVRMPQRSYSESILDPSEDVVMDSDNKTIQEDDGAEVKPRLLKKNEIKLSRQRAYFEDGSLPMPIYCAVRHEIERPGVTKAETMSSKMMEEEKEETESTEESIQVEEEENNGEKESEDDNEDDQKDKEESVPEINDLYQWFEFTPYDMGSEEINGNYIKTGLITELSTNSLICSLDPYLGIW